MKNKLKKHITKHLIAITIIATFSFISSTYAKEDSYQINLSYTPQFNIKAPDKYKLARQVMLDPRVNGSIAATPNKYIITDVTFEPHNIYKKRNIEVKVANFKTKAAYILLNPIKKAKTDKKEIKPETDKSISKTQYHVPKPLEDANTKTSYIHEINDFIIDNEHVFKNGKTYSEKSKTIFKKGTTYFDEIQVQINNNKKSFSSLSKLIDHLNIDSALSDNKEELNQLDDIETVYPIINHVNLCDNLALANSFPKNVLMSAAYTTGINYNETDRLFSEISLIYENKSRYIDDVIKLLSHQIKKKTPSIQTNILSFKNGVKLILTRKEPIRILHYPNKNDFTNNKGKKYTSGFYDPTYNVISFHNDIYQEQTKYSFIHESAHAIINNIFQNNAKPYKEKDVENKRYYEKCKLETLKNIAAKLGIADDFNSDERFLDLIKNNSILDLTFSLAHPIENIPKKMLIEIERKYFNDRSVFKEKNYRDIISQKLNIITKPLNLTEEDISIICSLSVLLHGYKEKELDSEIIVYIPQLLLNEKISEQKLNEYFSPLMEYWDNNISNKADVISVASL